MRVWFDPVAGLTMQRNGKTVAMRNRALEIETIVNVRDASYSILGNGNIRCVVGYDSSVRFNWPRAALRGGQSYQMSFTVVSVNGPASTDWCDGDDGVPGTVPPTILMLAPGPMSFAVSRPLYDATYRFLDIGSESEDYNEVTIEITRPTLTGIA